jgi:hypothetical protein
MKSKLMGLIACMRAEVHVMKAKSISLLALLSLLGFSPASADTIYTYTGNDFTSATGPYTTTDKVTGTMDLATALGDNFGPGEIFPVSFSFSDGVQTFSNVTPGIMADFTNFSTNASGTIVSWSVNIINQTATNEIFTSNVGGVSTDEGLHEPYVGLNDFDHGRWSSTVGVPGPLLGAGLPGLLAACGAVFMLARRCRRQVA